MRAELKEHGGALLHFIFPMSSSWYELIRARLVALLLSPSVPQRFPVTSLLNSSASLQEALFDTYLLTVLILLCRGNEFWVTVGIHFELLFFALFSLISCGSFTDLLFGFTFLRVAYLR